MPTFARAKLAGVYPGIDLVYYGASGERPEPALWSAGARSSFDQGSLLPPRPAITRAEARAAAASAVRGGRGSGGGGSSCLSPLATCLEYDFIVHPGADPKRIKLAFEGADRVRLADGDLILTAPAGDVRLKRPYAYQQIGGRRVQVACDYTLHSPLATHHSPQVGLKLARYDAAKPLVVDPMVLLYSTFLGGSDYDWGDAIAVDAAGCAYIAGTTASSNFYAVTSGAYDTNKYEGTAVFVTKLNVEGSHLVYSTYLDGYDDDFATGLAVDASGAAYVTGETESDRFPVLPNSIGFTYHGANDAFVSKLSADGSDLVYSVFLGGIGQDRGEAIAVNASGEAYVTGSTWSADFPTTTGAFDTTFNSGRDAFVSKLNASGLTLTYSTYLGGGLEDVGRAIALDASGRAYVAGYTLSADFPTTTGAFDISHNGGADVFVAKLNASGSGLAYSSLLGGSVNDYVEGIAVDGSGSAFVTGYTGSTDFPTTAGAFDTTHNGGYQATPYDAFVTRLNTNASALVYSTFLGGTAPDYGRGIAVDANGSAHVAGETVSTDFPTVAGALDRSANGYADAFVAKLDAAGSQLTYSTYLGAPDSDGAGAIALHSSGLVYLTGYTGSADFPRTDGSFNTLHRGAYDAFVAKLALDSVPTSLYTVNRAGTITETVRLRQYDLKRTIDNVLLEDQRVYYKIDGTEVGYATTDGGGDSYLDWIITDGPMVRTITAEFRGWGGYLGSSDDALLGAASWPTKMVVFDRTARITDRTELKARLLRNDNVPLYGKGIDFYVDGTAVATRDTDVAGYAKWPVYDVPDGAGAGSRTILAQWPGNAGYQEVHRTATLTVLKAIPYIWVLPKTIPQGAIASLYAYFRRLYDYQQQADKEVKFRIDGTTIQTVMTGPHGVARYLYHTTEPPGVYTIRCEFAGDAYVDPGYGEGNLTIY